MMRLIHPFDPGKVEHVKEFLRHEQRLVEALPQLHGTHEFDDIWSMVAAGKVEFWSGAQAFATAEYIVYPRVKAFHVFLVGGNDTGFSELKKWLERGGQAEKHWKEQGCDWLSYTGRKGWVSAIDDVEEVGVYCIIRSRPK